MDSPTQRRFGWPGAVFGLTLVLAVCAGLLPQPSSSFSSTPLGTVLLMLPFGPVGYLIARHQPRNPVGWMLLMVFGLFAVSAVGVGYELLVYRSGGHDLPLGTVSLFVAMLWAPAIVLISLPILLFPDGRLPSARWRGVLVAYLLSGACWVGGFVVIVALAVHDGDVHVLPGGDLTVADNPTGTMAWFGTGQVVFLAGMVAGWAAFLGLQVRNWRRSEGQRRLQFSWLMCGAAVCAVCGTVTITFGLLDPHPSLAASSTMNLLTVGVGALPASIGVAILRYRLYEIDVIVRRTLVYSSLVAVLAAIYLGGILLIGRSLDAITGQSGALAVTVSTLLVAGMFQPLRRRIQRAVDRRFYRSKYDAARTLDEFAARLRDQIDLAALQAEVLSVAQSTMQPRQASLWLRPVGASAIHPSKEAS